MGSTELVHDILGDDVSDELVEALNDGHARHIKAFEDDMRPFPDASALLKAVAARGATVVLATSANPDEVEHRVSLLDAGDAVTAITSSGDVEHAKPSPDIFLAAAEAGGVDIADCVAVGDATWDVLAAKAAGIDCIGLESGGFSEAELREAGAVAVYKDAAALLAGLESSVLA
jgi:HAD superfamily hydrolase (TIGR01509 family)